MAENIFQKAVSEREREQKSIESTCKGEKPRVGKPPRDVQRQSTTILLDPDKKLAIKKYALDNKTTISDLVNEWITEKCKEYLA